MNAQLKLVKLGDIRPNPFRDIEHYPIDRVKVELLRQSFERTGFWEGYLMVRPVRPSGGGAAVAYEQPWGHHRVVAAIELWGKDHEVPVVVKDLSDDMMLAMMAHENNEHYAQFFYLSVMEPIEAVVKAYAEGRVELEKPQEGQGHRSDTILHAPSFVRGTAGTGRTYTAVIVAKYLGWTKAAGERSKDGLKADDRVLTALAALELIEKKVRTRQEFLALTQEQAESLVRVSKATIKAYEADAEANAKVHDEVAAREERSGNKRKAEEHKATALRERETAQDKAFKAAKTVGAQVAERLAAGEPVMTVLEDTVAAEIKEAAKKDKKINKGLASTLPYTAAELDSLSKKYDKLATEIERERASGCKSPKSKKELAASLKSLRERLSLYIKALGG